jgi:hypothetical protein
VEALTVLHREHVKDSQEEKWLKTAVSSLNNINWLT